MGNRTASVRLNQISEKTYIIWLDASVNSEEENVEIQKQCRQLFDILLTFDDDKKFLRYMRSISREDSIILVVSGRYGRIIVPKIIEYRQITEIYVYCRDKESNRRWAKRYSKVCLLI